MCSVATTFRKGLVLFIKEHDELRSLFPATVRDVVGGYKTYAPILLKDMNKTANEQELREFWEDRYLQEFIKSAYTPANLIVVPDGFNSARFNRTDDYWDETLRQLFVDFDSNDPLMYRGFNVGEPFSMLIKKSREDGDGLFLDGWLDSENKAMMLPSKKPVSVADWHDLMHAMTLRIENRLQLMQRHLDTLQ